ncbi:MAG TPA: lytic transglycosylase domain-containing protein [Longimicrobiales bacterium]|nr:lytic transglycosylase domain-containing protein [Longimicrobiales bacterium]
MSDNGTEGPATPAREPAGGAVLRAGPAAPPRGFTAGDAPGFVLWQWERQGWSPWRYHVALQWKRHQRHVRQALVLVATFLLGAFVMVRPELELSNLQLRDALLLREGELQARQGELELARLELNRLTRIAQFSAAHRIPADLAESIYDMAVAEGIDPRLAFGLVSVESDFTRRAVSSKGAVGLTQVMPSTAFWLQPGLDYKDLFEPDTNLRLGFRYLRMLMTQYGGDLRLALLAYNRGPGRVDDILRTGGNPSNGYAGAVRTRASRMTD